GDLNGDGIEDLVVGKIGGPADLILGFATGSTPQTITFAGLNNATLGAAPFTVSATASSGRAVSLASATPTVCTVAGTLVTLVTRGSCTIIASQPGNATYAAAQTVVQSFNVVQPQSISFGPLSDVPLTSGSVSVT